MRVFAEDAWESFPFVVGCYVKMTGARKRVKEQRAKEPATLLVVKLIRRKEPCLMRGQRSGRTGRNIMIITDRRLF